MIEWIKSMFLLSYPFVLILTFAIFTPMVINKGLRKIGDMSFFQGNKKPKTFYSLISSFVRYGIYFISIIMILKRFNVDLTPVLASAGLLTVVLGLSANSILKDVFTGIFILFENQMNIGDVVSINDGAKGEVEELGIRTVGLREWSMRKVYIPYSEIKKIKNFHKEHGRVIEKITIPYEIDPLLMNDYLTEVCLQMNEKCKEFLVTKPENQIKENDESIYIEEFKSSGVISLNEASLSGVTYAVTGVVICDEVFNCSRDLRELMLTHLLSKGIRPAYHKTIIENQESYVKIH